MSGRSSSCSVVQEENLVRRMRKTPETPIKTGCQITPKKTGSKRCLFEMISPTESDDLGPVSPMSVTSCSSLNSFGSPNFSPNGTFTTPPRTPKNDNNVSTPTRRSLRHTSRKIEVKSSLFPDLKLSTPKSRHTPKTPRTLLSKMLTPQSKVDSVEDIEEGIRSLSTPSTSCSIKRRQIFSDSIVAESPTSIIESSQEYEEECLIKKIDAPTKLGIKPISCESFYGKVPETPKVRMNLLIDSLGPKRALIRSESKESLSSNRSFVKGGNRQRTQSNHRTRPSRGDRRKAPHVGVWHNIRKPKQIKKLVKVEKPLISPQSRIAKMMNSVKKKEIKVRSKPLFQGNPRKRIAHSKKRSRKEMEDDSIIDSFPDRLIKRKKLPTPQYSVHPAIEEKVQSPENLTPDPNKKFLKYGPTRKATFTLTENVRFRISDGVMKLKTPKKRRKLYSGRKDIIEDFNDFEDGDEEIEQNIQGILNRLRTEKENAGEFKSQSQAAKDSVAQIFHDLENKNKTPCKTIATTQRSPLKSVSNLPTLIINDFETDEENSPVKQSQEKNPNELSLAKTGNMVSYLTNILVNKDQEVECNSPVPEDEIENTVPSENGKFYSVFYKQNWNKTPTNNESGNVKADTSKKKILVPDDQYLLDAGQSSIGIITCKKCGVMYQAGDFADEATHNNFHNHLPELRFNGWANERVVGRYPNGKVIMILNCDPKTWWQKVSKVVDIVDQELGFPEASVKSLYHKTVYFYINEKSKQIAGCLIAEECKVAYRMFPPLEGVDIDSCSKDPSPCKVGISRIWTSLSHRRKGVATRLIDCLQRTFLFGDIVPIDQVAFSVPSPMGKLLAQKVTGRFDFLVYGFA